MHLSELLTVSKKEMLDIVADALRAAEEEAGAKAVVLKQLEESKAYISHLEAQMMGESARALQDSDTSAVGGSPQTPFHELGRHASFSPCYDLGRVASLSPCSSAAKQMVGGFLGASQMSFVMPRRSPPVSTSKNANSSQHQLAPSPATISLSDAGVDGEVEDASATISDLSEQCRELEARALAGEAAAKLREHDCAHLREHIQTLKVDSAASAAASAVAGELQLQQVLLTLVCHVFRAVKGYVARIVGYGMLASACLRTLACQCLLLPDMEDV